MGWTGNVRSQAFDVRETVPMYAGKRHNPHSAISSFLVSVGMNRNMVWFAVLALAGCAAEPEHSEAHITDTSGGAPWGLAWIPSGGDVAITPGAIQHVLYPAAHALPTGLEANKAAHGEASGSMKGPLTPLRILRDDSQGIDKRYPVDFCLTGE